MRYMLFFNNFIVATILKIITILKIYQVVFLTEKHEALCNKNLPQFKYK